ncbi:hypothetical protein CSUI_005370, partial [Cystoisospora suis]
DEAHSLVMRSHKDNFFPVRRGRGSSFFSCMHRCMHALPSYGGGSPHHYLFVWINKQVLPFHLIHRHSM